jgi:predicted nicotinamide N-methyase
MEPSSKPKKYLEKWDQLRKTIYSSDRLNLLNNIPILDLKIFIKEITTSQNKSIIIYKDISEKLKHEYELLINMEFYPIRIEKPNFNFAETSDDNLKEYYSEKVDNTGNVNIWPSEEILAIYSILNKNRFENKKIIELGAGFSGLAGLIVAKNIPSSYVTITDGNTKCVEYLKRNIQLNGLDKNAEGKVLLWDRNNTLSVSEFKYDYVIISDCIFFKNYHEDLIETIYNLISDDGICIIIAPPRGDSLEKFLDLAVRKFKIYKSKDEIKFYSCCLDTTTTSFSPFYIEMCKK